MQRESPHAREACRAQIFDELRADWTAVIGDGRLGALEDDLRRVTADGPGRLLDIPGWFSRP